MDSSRRNYVRFVGGFLILLFVGMLVFTIYRMQSLSHRAEDAERLVQTIDRVNAELKQRQAQDTYGGKTPQETLQLYIDAVEKGDYELASKYFVVEKQEQWAKQLKDIKSENKIEAFLSPLRVALGNTGEYSEKKDTFSIYKPVLVDFILYPSGNWKISEI